MARSASTKSSKTNEPPFVNRKKLKKEEKPPKGNKNNRKRKTATTPDARRFLMIIRYMSHLNGDCLPASLNFADQLIYATRLLLLALGGAGDTNELTGNLSIESGLHLWERNGSINVGPIAHGDGFSHINMTGSPIVPREGEVGQTIPEGEFTWCTIDADDLGQAVFVQWSPPRFLLYCVIVHNNGESDMLCYFIDTPTLSISNIFLSYLQLYN
jgi:hypothetical protein